MSFPEWMMLIEQSGTSVNGVDMNWLQAQYQSNQQPSFVAQMIMTGNAPRPGMQPMMAPMMQPMYAQPMYQQPAKPRGGGFGTFMNVFMGILGFVVIIGAILWGLMIYAKQHEAQTGGKHVTIEGGDSSALTQDQPSEAERKAKGLDPTLFYPFYPLIYDQGMTAAADVIFGKVKNYGDKPVKNVTIRFGLFSKSGEKVGTAEDHIASLEAGATWDYRAKVANNYDQCRVDEITFSK